ncbi:hypothetical protein CPT_Shaeky_085 [Streptomyces phage Shaeky]|uniref:Peptidase C1A papain C-terminal domain-containing protein n=1 Tax=Streptomyces phage Shaeky TaxID=2767586 RepID=A0A873WHY0_9CAUD|nr:hypothetical protein CPT_Shaeky_085 [Streptomyces phage Shaeky]
MYVRRYATTDNRLGRHVRHDPRSLRYAHPVLPRTAIRAVQWQRRIPIFDQGALGSCTGNALAGVLGTDSVDRVGTSSVSVKADPYGVFAAGTYTLNESFAVRLYSLNTRVDSFAGTYPPQDTGSNGLASVKAAQSLGLLSGYTHAFSVAALQTALMSGPVLWGTLWLQSMFETDSSGFVRVDPSSGSAGGHQLVISGYDPARDVYTVQNSWGLGWGNNGFGRVQGSDMAWLLSQDGDLTVPVYATATPEPTEVVSPPPLVVEPAADADKTLFDAFTAWVKAKGYDV